MSRSLVILSYKRKSRALAKIMAGLKDAGIEITQFLYPGAEAWEGLVLPKDCVIFNWGWGHEGAPLGEYINPPHLVELSVNKLQTYRALVAAGMVDCLPNVAFSRLSAKQALLDKTIKKWVCRTKLEGKDGDGIHVTSDPEAIPNAKMYVEYVPCIREFRVHINVRGTAFVTEKVWDTDNHPDDLRVGTTFYMAAVDYTEKPVIQCKEAAFMAVEALGLDFAGVDVGWDGARPWIFETNTAPGMFGGRTTEFYVDIIKQRLEDR